MSVSVRCADASVAAGESLAGTAATAESWLLVEVRGTWPRDVSDVLDGTDPVSRWLEATPASRVLFIRKPGAPRGPHSAFVVRSTESEASARRLTFDDLHDVDLDAGEPVDSPLVLVCGHGTRDACCALRGSAVYAALATELPPDTLWISSHQGGHRFAANVLVLPSGIQLGRLGADDLDVVHDACAGRIALEHYRGRTVYRPSVQAAEAVVRAAAGFLAVGSLTLVVDDGAEVLFAGRDGESFAVAVEEVVGPTVPASCGAVAEPQKAFAARLV